MKKLASFAMMAGLGLATTGCSTILGMFGMGGGGATDMAAMMKDSYKASYVVSLHSGAAVGQWASWEASGTELWWGVTGEKDGNLVVENRMGGMTYIFVVDAEGNTQEAYIANWKADAEELSEAHKVAIAEKTDAPAGDAPETETGEETVTAAGQDWACTWTKVDAGGKPATSWMCDDAWFNKMIKSEYDGTVNMILKETGAEGATMGFKWAEEKE
jgi:hypothetical protein